ncbi:MAG: tetratricopeptide repeat protein [Bacteroidales bacterium]|jgi:tetratricopeptide (TPR) repeat protein|nr:tetratricopeptide repeat protein [Bacteroidales bacterium]MDD3700834.1 tetratricopeptide repeat protein [Bacteroidales bacterium]MDY0369419.1 tetratricopeptide repeat protein [Bacteroidales bacterium]
MSVSFAKSLFFSPYEHRSPIDIKPFALILFVLIIILSHSRLVAQHTKYFDPYPMLYREGLERIQAGQYGTAKDKMEAFIQEETDPNHVLLADAHYYALLCAVQLKQEDATEKIQAFAAQYTSSAWMPVINFLHGRVLFEQRRYSEALVWFEQTDPQSLADFEQAELAYKSGFCLMRQNKTAQAIDFFAKAKDFDGIYQQTAMYYYAHLNYLQENDLEAASYFEKLQYVPSYKKIVPQYLLHIHHRQGDYQYVTLHGEEVMELSDSKRRPDLTLLVADAWYKSEEYIKALYFYKLAENYGRRQLEREDAYQKGICQFKSGAFTDAILMLEQIAGSADDVLAQNTAYHLGLAYYETEQKVFARNAFLKAYKLNHNQQLTDDALFKYAQLSLETNPEPYNEAINLLEEYLKTQAASAQKEQAEQLLIQLYLHTKNFDSALASLEKNKTGKPQLEKIYQQISYAVGNESFLQGDVQKAITYFQPIIQVTNSEYGALALFWTAEALMQTGQYSEALQRLKQFGGHKFASSTGLLPQAAFQTAYAHFQLGQYKQALPYFNQFIQHQRADENLRYDAWLRIGDCYFIQKEYNRAIDAYNQVILVNQAGTDYALLQKGLASGALGRFTDKTEALDRLIKQFSSSNYYEQALYEMGSTHLILNDSRSAIIFFDRLAQQRPRSVYARDAMHKTALIYFNNNQNEEAITWLKKIIQLYPGTPDARQAMNTLKAIYLEMNLIQEYVSFANQLGFGTISNAEQDSLTFSQAENLYQEGRFEQALSAFEQYIQQQGGAYLLPAHHYLYQIYIRNAEEDKALQSINYIISIDGNPYMEQALLYAARIYYDRQQYNQASRLYNDLYHLATQSSEKMEALEGKMKSAYFTDDFTQAIEAAHLIQTNTASSSAQQLQAYYIAGKSLFETDRNEEAYSSLQEVRQQDRGRLGAEALYLMARISFRQNRLEDTENAIFELSEQYASQDYWVANGFILLADVYVRQNNIYQAKETLKSIMDNYQGDDLKQEAARKLEMLNG